MHHHVRLLHETHRAEGEKVGVAGAGPDEIHLADHGLFAIRTLRPKRGRERRARVVEAARERHLRDRSFEDAVPECPPVGDPGKAGIDLRPGGARELREPAEGTRNEGLDPGPDVAGERGRGAPGGDGGEHRGAVDDRGHREVPAPGVRGAVRENAARFGERHDPSVEAAIVGRRDDEPPPFKVRLLEPAAPQFHHPVVCELGNRIAHLRGDDAHPSPGGREHLGLARPDRPGPDHQARPAAEVQEYGELLQLDLPRCAAQPPRGVPSRFRMMTGFVPGERAPFPLTRRFPRKRDSECPRILRSAWPCERCGRDAGFVPFPIRSEETRRAITGTSKVYATRQPPPGRPRCPGAGSPEAEVGGPSWRRNMTFVPNRSPVQAGREPAGTAGSVGRPQSAPRRGGRPVSCRAGRPRTVLGADSHAAAAREARNLPSLVHGEAPIRCREVGPAGAGKRKRKSSTRARGGGRRDEWIGGRLLPPFFVDDPEEEPFRPELVVWLDSQGLIVGHALSAPGETEGILARTLIEAMERPLIGPRRRPSALRVPDRSSAAEVRAAVGNRIPVRIAPTPELDEVLESMAESFPAPPAGKGRHPSYFENGRIPEETVAELFAAARLFHETAPWEVVSDDQVLALDIPDFDVDGACLSIIGNLGESFGAIVFPSFGHYMVFVGLADSEPREEGGLRNFGTSGLSLNFVTGAELPVSMRREVASHAWPVAATDAYPHVARFDRDGTPFPTRPRDLRIAAAAAEAFCRFFATHRDLFAGERVAAGPVSESYSVLDGVEVRLTALTGPWSLARGEGADSGRVSTPAPEGAAYPAHILDRALVTDLETFAFTQFGDAWLNYLDDFEDPTEVAQLASPWSVFHFRPKQETVLEAFLRFAPRSLSPEERSWLEAQRAAWLSVWEVDAVDPGVSLTLRDLLSGEERFVHESEGSKKLVLRDAVLGRVVDHEKGSFVCGLHPNPLPPWDAAEVVRRARGRLRRRRQVPVDRLRDEAFGRYLIRRWEEAVDRLDERTSVPPDLRNTDGDVLLLTTDHFRLEPAAVGEVAAGLAAMEGV